MRSWFAGTGCDGWVVQRELAAPEDYVTAWLRDTDEGPRFDALYAEWLDALEGVEAVAFGVLAMRPGRSGWCWRRSTSRWPRPGASRCARTSPPRTCSAPTCARPGWRCATTCACTRWPRRTDDGWYADSSLLQQEAGLRWRGASTRTARRCSRGATAPGGSATCWRCWPASAGLSEGEAAEQVLPVVQRLVEQGSLVPPR